MSISITKSLTTPKVNVGMADNAWSSRQIYADEAVVPKRFPVDMYGRPSSYETLYTATQGATCPHHIINRQNNLDRPQYSSYLNVSQGLEGGYDTMLGSGNLGRSNAFQTQPVVSVPKSSNSNVNLARIMQTRYNKVRNAPSGY
jgi:hypothetical protein